jgi:hypothetical protein
MALVRWWSPAVLFRPDRSWWRLWLLMMAGSCGMVFVAGRLAADALGRFMSTRLGEAPLAPLPFSRTALLAIAAFAVVTGALLRVAWLADPPPLFSDEVTLISPTLALEGSLRDFLPPYRGVPYGIEKPWGSVGVVYLEVFRGALRTFGLNPAGLRVTSVLGGVASLLTATLLARALLPAGGGALAALALAGLRWHLIMSSWGWVAICVTPVLDLAAWLLVRGRVKRSVPFTIAAGILAGIGGHIYLAGWVGFGALLLFRLWPVDDGETRRHRVSHAAIFAVAFLGSVLPLFVLARKGEAPYFARVRSHNLLREFRLRQSVLPLFEATAEGLGAPWFVPEPQGWADLPGRSRLGLVLGVLVAVAFARSFSRSRDAFSAFLLAHGAFALAASVAQGTCGSPNGYRFVYLTSATAIAAAGGAIAVVSVLPRRGRRAGALAITGLVAIAGAFGARDALVLWPVSRFRFEGFRAGETLLAEAAERWRAYGTVSVEIMGESMLVSSLSNHRVFSGPAPASPGARRFRICRPEDSGRPGERSVELVQDAWGGELARVLAVPSGSR